MDLAKIRKKSLDMLKEFGDSYFTIHSPAATPTSSASQPVQSAPDPAGDMAFIRNESAVSSGAVPSPAGRPFAPPCFEQSDQTTPLAAILAGRKAAGCVELSDQADETTGEPDVDSYLEYLSFRVSDEIYGINIMEIKEIIKPREVTEVPHAPEFVAGIISLRGTIIPVIDLRARLGLAHCETSGKERIIVIKYGNSYSGLLADEVIKVVQIPLDSVEAAPAVLEGINRDFIRGLGRSQGRLIILLNLDNIADIDLQ